MAQAILGFDRNFGVIKDTHFTAYSLPVYQRKVGTEIEMWPILVTLPDSSPDKKG